MENESPETQTPTPGPGPGPGPTAAPEQKSLLEAAKTAAEALWKQVGEAEGMMTFWDDKIKRARESSDNEQRPRKRIRVAGMYAATLVTESPESRREKEAKKAADLDEAIRECNEATSVVLELKNRAKKEYARYQVMNAQFGHPGALQEGGWAEIDEGARDGVVGALGAFVHSARTLKIAGYPMFSTLPTAPDADLAVQKRRVVSLDCEFVGGLDSDGTFGKHILAQVCMVDVLTGEVLLDILVDPSEPKIDYRTKHSGLNEWTYAEYREQNLVVPDRRAARERIFGFIDSETILTGFALHNDVKCLNMKHTRVVDPQILGRQAIMQFYKYLVNPPGLKTMCWKLLKKQLQASSFGHDCTEDCFAARELLILWMEDGTKEAREEWAAEAGRQTGVNDVLRY